MEESSPISHIPPPWSSFLWGDLMIKTPVVLHWDVCRGKSSSSPRNHVHMACSKNHQRAVVEFLWSPPTRFAGGGNGTWAISLLLPLSSLPFYSFSFSSFLLLFRTLLLTDLENIPKGKRQHKSYFGECAIILTCNYTHMPFSISKQL